MENKFQEFFCPICREYVKKSLFEQHKISHWNDPGEYPETLEKLKQRFEPLGVYDER
jgi:hypothetical protein